MNNYKKVILTLLVAILGIGAMNAQFRFGVKAGLNLNSLHLSDLKSNFTKDNSCGYTAGVMGELQVPVIGLGFDLSLMYTRMNSTFDPATTVAGETVEESISKNFLELPLNVKYKIGLPLVGRIVTPYIYTGPTFAFRLDKNTLKDFSQKKCQTAWNVGVGVELFRHLQVQGSYGFGMSNTVMGVINKVTDAGIQQEQIKAKNNYWTITAAWLF